LRTLQRK